MEESPTITLKVVYTFSDGLHNRRYISTRKLGGAFSKLLAMALFGAGCFYTYMSYQRWLVSVPLEWTDFFLPIGFFAASVIEWFDLASLFGLWRAARDRAKSPPEEYVFTVDDTGIRYTLGDEPIKEDVKFAWSRFQDIRESEQAFFVIMGKNDYWSLPKRFFATRDEMRAFRDLANRHVEKARL